MKLNVHSEWLFLILTSVMLVLVGMFMPFIAPAAIMTSCAPFMILTLRQGTGRALAGVLLGSSLVALMFDPFTAIFYGLGFGFLGVTFAELSKKIKKGSDYLIMAIAVSAAVKVLLMVLFVAITGVHPFIVTRESMQPMVEMFAGAFGNGGAALSPEKVEAYVQAMISTAKRLLPSMILLFAAFDTIVSYALSVFAAKKLGGFKLPKVPPFALWRFPKDIFWALLASILIDLLSRAMPDQYTLSLISANLMEVLRAIFIVEGLALCWYYMTAKGISKIFKTIAVVLGVAFPPVSYILSLVGIFDIWYDLRSRIARRN